MLKDSLFKRVAAIEKQGPGFQINTVADWAIVAAMELEGRYVGHLTYSPVMQKYCDDWAQFSLDCDVECAFLQFERWLV